MLAGKAGTSVTIRGDAMKTLRFILICLVMIFLCSCGSDSSSSHPSNRVVVKMIGDVIASIHLIRNKDNKEVLTAYPHGRSLAWSNYDNLEVKEMTFSEYKKFMAGRETSSSAAATSTYNTGLPVGYDPSLGPTSTSCFNFNSQITGAPTTRLSFSSQNTASSNAAQTNISASVKLSYGAFKATDDFSFSDNYKNSANSGNIYFSAYVIYTLQNAYDSNNPLNSFGQMLKSQGAVPFVQQCGSNFITVVPAGMLAYGEFSFSSNSSQASQAISNTLKANYGLNSLSLAVNAAKQVANSSAQMDFTLTIMGGGPTATNIIVTAYNNESADLKQCIEGTASNCDSFAVAINGAVAKAAATFQSEVTTPLPSDISIFETFPNGVSGVSTGQLMYLPISGIVAGASDLYKQYQTQLNTYVGLLNQIGTLYSRASVLNDKIYGTAYNPQSLLNLSGYLVSIQNTYRTDKNNMIQNLFNCLGDVTQCGPIVNNTITNPYTWYGTPSPAGNKNFLAQQNTIALQYAGIYSDFENYQYPNDIVYTDVLPPFQSPAQDISGKASLIGFTDATFYTGGNYQNTASLIILPMLPNNDISTVYSTAIMKYHGIWTSDWSSGTGTQSLIWTTASCQPTFANPCSIGYKWASSPSGMYPTGIVMTAIPDFFTVH
jgi:hypothetical protein